MLNMKELKDIDHFKKFQKDKNYIGVKLHHHDGLSIESFQGKPYNKHEYDLIGHYSVSLWDKLLDEIKKEADENNKDVRIDELNHCAFVTRKWL